MIERRLENLLALDYPADRLEIVVASDASRTGRTRSSRPSRRTSPASGCSTARAGARSRRRIGPCARRRATSSRSPTRTRRGRRMRCGTWSRISPTRRSRTCAARSGSPTRRGTTARASTGATSSGSASRSRGSARSRAGTARSTRSGAATTSRSTRAGGTISRCRTGWCRTAAVRCSSRRRRRSSGRHRRTRRSTRGRCACSSTAGRSRSAGRDAAPPAAGISRLRWSRIACCATRAGCSTSCCSGRASCSCGAGWPYVLALARPARARCRIRRTRPDRAVLRVRHLGHRSGPVELRQARRPGRLGPSGHAMNRAADVALAGVGLALTSPLLARGGARDQARGRRPRALPADPRRQGGEGLRAPQAPLDVRRRRAPGRGLRRRSRRRADHAGRAGSSGGRRSTSCRSSGTCFAATCR